MRLPKIILKDIFKIYKDFISHLETVALKEVNLEIFEGEIVCIIGPSGSGKSTLLNMIGGLDIPSAGQVIHRNEGNEIALSSLTKDERDIYRSNNIGFMNQTPILFNNYSALENVQLGLKNQGFLKTSKQAISWLRKVGLGHRLNNRPHHLSGGERQRVSLAAALVISPKILLLDEPTGDVDSITAQNIIDLLVNINSDTNLTIIIVTHDKLVAKIADRVFHILDGKLVSYELKRSNDLRDMIKDEFGRFTLPPDAMMRLNNPNIIGLEEIGKNKYRIINMERSEILDAKHGYIVDKEGRVKLQFTDDHLSLSIHNSGIDLIVGGEKK